MRDCLGRPVASRPRPSQPLRPSLCQHRPVNPDSERLAQLGRLTECWSTVRLAVRPNSFLLGGGGSVWLWNGGGPADCTANLFYFGMHAGSQTYNLLASTSFAAN
jgi:hypothetical protein